MSKKFLLHLCLWHVINAWATPDRLDTILQRGSVRVGTTGDYCPFSCIDQRSGHYQGLDIELAKNLAKSLDVKLEFVPTSWSNLMQDHLQNKFDIVMSGVSINLTRQKQALYSIPYLNDGKTPITRCENQALFQSIEQIDQPHVRVIVNPGGTNEHFARTYLPKATLTVYPDNINIFQQIIDKHADVMVTDAIETRYQQILSPQLCALHPDKPFTFSQKAYLLPNDWRWKAWVDQWLNQMLQNGSFTTLAKTWLGAPITP